MVANQGDTEEKGLILQKEMKMLKGYKMLSHRKRRPSSLTPAKLRPRHGGRVSKFQSEEKKKQVWEERLACTAWEQKEA